MMVLLTKIINNVHLKTLTIIAERLILVVAWLGQGGVSADAYITVLKIQMQMCKDRRCV